MVAHNALSFFFIYVSSALYYLNRGNGTNFLKSAFKSMGPRQWHISEDGVAVLLGIGKDGNNDRSGAVRLAYEMRYMTFLCAHRFIRFFSAFRFGFALHIFALHNRNKKFNGVTKSEVVGYNKAGQRQRPLSFGNPPLGVNGGNTANNTHKVLKIVERAYEEKTRNYGDGGWQAALSVCVNEHVHNHSPSKNTP